MKQNKRFAMWKKIFCAFLVLCLVFSWCSMNVALADGDQQPEETAQPEETTQPEETLQPEETTQPEETLQPESTAENAMPAIHFTERASNGVSVVADADKGVFPLGTTMRVAAVSTDAAIQAAQNAVSGEVVDAKAVNITFYDVNGNEIQPADNTRVHITLNSSDAVEGSEYAVVHIEGNDAEVIADASATRASFDADSFSIYAIIGQTDGKATITYEYYNDSSAPTLLSSSIVKDGDVLVAPGTPVSTVDSTATFLGWSTADAPTEYQTFGTVTIPSMVTSDTTVKLYARFSKTYHAFFYNQFSTILQSFPAVRGDNFHVADYNSYVTFPIPAGQALIGWSTILSPSGVQTGLGSEAGIVTDLTITADVNLYPVLASVYWITYVSNGGSYTAAEYFRLGTNTDEPTTPTRPGYTFGGWYTDVGLLSSYTFGSPLSADINLYAKWTANEVSYMVVYWVEVLDSNSNYVAGNYAYADSQTLQAVVDSKVSIDAVNVGRNYAYYSFDHGDENVTIAGDGHTIVNAYFDLNTYALVFDLSDISADPSFRTSTLTLGGSVYNAGNPYSFVAHYGENIAAKWPAAGNISTVVSDVSVNSQFYAWTREGGGTYYVSKRLTLTAQLLSSTDDLSTTIFTANYLSSLTNYEINYWLENANDTGYTKSAEYSQEAQAQAGTSWSAKQISGFTNISVTPDGYPASEGITYNFYYTRNTYRLDFSSSGTTETSIGSIKFGSDISSYVYTPTRPLSLSSDYQFAGWYSTPNCHQGTEFDFSSAIMPSHNLIVYAKWTLPQYTVGFDLNGGTSPEIADQTDMFGKLISCPEPPTREGYVFSGWTLGGKAFKTDSTYISGSVLQYATDGVITLEAQWIGGAILQVKYNAAEGTNAPADSGAYYNSAEVVLARASTPPAGKYFLYWTVNGANYFPGETITLDAGKAVNGVVTLTAVYGTEPSPTSITYHPNGGSGSNYTTDPVSNNAEVTILNRNNAKISYYRDGYAFRGWNTMANGRGTSYTAGEVVRIDNIGSNDLYAQWSKTSELPGTGDDQTPVYVLSGIMAAALVAGLGIILTSKRGLKKRKLKEWIEHELNTDQ